MLIRLQDYKEGDIVSVQEDYDPKKLDLEFVDFHYSKPLSMKGTVEKGHDLLTFRGEITSQTEVMCGRCLKEMNASLEKDFEFFYEIKGKEFIDTTDDLREMLILEHNLAYVCSENCRGLCPVCGINRNEKTCQCQPQGENSLAQLKDKWKNKKQESE